MTNKFDPNAIPWCLTLEKNCEGATLSQQLWLFKNAAATLEKEKLLAEENLRIEKTEHQKTNEQLRIAMEFLHRVESMKDIMVQWGIVTNVMKEIDKVGDKND